MTNARLRISLIASTLVLTIFGCAMPGLTPVSAPAPTADTVLLVTIVAETVAAALEETASAVAPIPTSTPTLPPPTETATASAEVTASGSLLTKRDDGSTLFADQRGGYELIVPAGWLALRVNEQEYLDAWTLPETADPAIQRSLTSIQNQDPNQFRLFVLDTQEGHVQGGFVTNINILWNQNETITLDDFTYLDSVAAELPNAIPGAEVLSTELTTTSNNIPMGIVTLQWTTQTEEGATVTVFQKQVYFRLNAGSLVITLTTSNELMDTVLPAFDAMIETFAIVN